MVLDVNFPKFSSLFIFIITLIIDVNTNGITNIFNKSINPYPTRPYQVVTSFSQLICVGSLGNLAMYWIINPKIVPIPIDTSINLVKFKLFFILLITKNSPISNAINKTVLIFEILINSDKNVLPILISFILLSFW